MWRIMIGSLISDLTTGSWITRLLSTGLVVCSLFSLGYLGGSSLPILQTLIKPEPSVTRTNGWPYAPSSGSLMERHEMLRAAKKMPLDSKPGSTILSTETTGGK